ncbi:MAG: helix-turn-helix domain-containing protein [Bacilli bacterium]|nr:helix-turn-helix domain-containing protein [Bacilli bacterium]
MLKEYLKTKKLSVYKLAELSNVPYTTLNELINGKKRIDDCKIKTIENIAKALNISIESLLQLLNNKNIVLSNSWQENKDKVFYFPIVVNNSNYQANRIHPLMQRAVNDIYEYVKTNNSIEKVIIFGSAINIRCNNKSDIDVALKIRNECFNIEYRNKISEIIQEISNFNADIIWLNTIDKNSRLYENVCKKGVVIYEQVISKSKSKEI